MIPHKVRRNGKECYELIDLKRVKGKLVQKYVGYLGKSPNSKTEMDPEQILLYVSRLLGKEMSQEENAEILKKF